jgi:hypothetical protein
LLIVSSFTLSVAFAAEHPKIEYTPPPGVKLNMEPPPKNEGEARTFTIGTPNGNRDLSAADFVDGKTKGYGDTLTFKPKNATPEQLKNWKKDGIIPGKKYEIKYAH